MCNYNIFKHVLKKCAKSASFVPETDASGAKCVFPFLYAKSVGIPVIIFFVSSMQTNQSIRLRPHCKYTLCLLVVHMDTKL